MKKTIIFLLSTMLLFTACKDSFLDSDPIVLQTAEGYFQTPKNALEGLTGCYNGLVLDEWENIYTISTIASDEAFAGGGAGESDAGTPFGWDQFKEAGNRNQNANIWKNRYSAVYRCNSFIKNLSGVNWGDGEDLSLKYEAEARFLRAYFYFDLVKFFGNIPLIKTPEVVNTKQALPVEVYAFIAEDLKFAIENLPATAYSQIKTSEYGRATKWAAEALMARVFLFYTGRYNQTDLAGIITKAQTLSYIEDIISHSEHGLVSAFKNLWPVASIDGSGAYVGEDNKETVFAIKYSYGLGQGKKGNNQWLISFGLRWHDGTPAPYSWGWGQATVLPKYWNNVFESGDSRKTASIISITDELQDSVSKKDENGNIIQKAFNWKQFADYTGYFNKKYVPLSASLTNFTELPKSISSTSNPQYDQFQDWVIIRYADVLLMAAELGSPNADNYFNLVRDRAFGDQLHRMSGITIQDIRKERQRELAFEGIRYWDLLRYGPAIASQELNTNEDAIEGEKPDGSPKPKPKNIVYDLEKNGLFQIPWDQIDLSEENGEKFLQQNPGW